jgi:HlyD family secretion protein
MEDIPDQIRRAPVWQHGTIYLLSATAILAALGASYIARSETQQQQLKPAIIRALWSTIAPKITVMGSVEEGGFSISHAPLDGKVTAVKFSYGQIVEQGQNLLEIDPSDAVIKLRTATIELNRASNRLAELRNWPTGFEVSRARRYLAEAQQARDDAAQRVTELETLLDKGIIPRLEYEAGMQQLKSAEMRLSLHKDELTQTLNKGQGAYLELAQLEKLASEQRVAELRPASGLGMVQSERGGRILELVRSQKADDASPRIAVGTFLPKGKPLFKIVDLDNVKVLFRLNEVDVNRVRLGQAVEVSSDAFPGLVKGEISEIAAVGDSTASPQTHVAVFDIRAVLPNLDNVQQRQIKIGMSAKVSVIEEAHRAIVVPVSAIKESRGKRLVTIIDAKSGQHVAREVQLGAGTPSGVEIIAGVTAGKLLLAD